MYFFVCNSLFCNITLLCFVNSPYFNKSMFYYMWIQLLVLESFYLVHNSWFIYNVINPVDSSFHHALSMFQNVLHLMLSIQFFCVLTMKASQFYIYTHMYVTVLLNFKLVNLKMLLTVSKRQWLNLYSERQRRGKNAHCLC